MTKPNIKPRKKTPAMKTPLHIEVVSDVVCPWCYIGKRRLEAALALFAQTHPDQPKPELSWLPFQLNPDMPSSGMSRADYLQRKFGAADGGGIYERVSSEGHKENLAFAFDKIARQPNTLKAHALIHTARGLGMQAAVKEALMEAYFMQGADLTNDEALMEAAGQGGLPREAAQAVLQDTALHEALANEEAQMREMGITGVPFFIINRKIGVSGAQMPTHLLAAFEQAIG
jgi:predicted DsbA family dithiol-disulfide isomerase